VEKLFQELTEPVAGDEDDEKEASLEESDENACSNSKDWSDTVPESSETAGGEAEEAPIFADPTKDPDETPKSEAAPGAIASSSERCHLAKAETVERSGSIKGRACRRTGWGGAHCHEL